MTYIRLRKNTPNPGRPIEETGPDDAEDTPDDDQEENAPEEEPGEEPPPGFLTALLRGARDWYAWLGATIGTGPALAVHLVAAWALCYYDGWTPWAIGTVLFLAVGTFMPAPEAGRIIQRLENLGSAQQPPASPPAAGTPDEEAAAGDAEGGDGPPTDPLVTTLWRLIGDAPGVHLKTLVQHLAHAAEQAGAPAPSKDQVVTALERRGITLRPSVRDTRDKVNRGVHREDLEAALRTPPLPASKAPPESP